MALFDQALQEGQDEQKRISQWQDIIRSPQAQAALLQFGISMLQPGGFGASFPGAVGRAIGEGGEAAQRVTKQQQATESHAQDIQDAQLKREEAQQRIGLAERRTKAYEQAVSQKGKGGGLSASQLFSQYKFGVADFRRWFDDQMKGAGLTPDDTASAWLELQTNPEKLQAMIAQYKLRQKATEAAVPPIPGMGTGGGGVEGERPPPPGWDPEEWNALTPEEQAQY
jgi:hypothetical protein